MSWLFSQVLVEEYLAANSLDGEQSVQSSGNPIQQAYCAPDKMTDFSRIVDVVSGGFPCQAYSTAAAGKNTADDLWPEMRRIVADVAPRYVFAENVSRIAIDQAADDCESMGYKTRAIALSASDMGADHIRERYWLLAYADHDGELLRPINAETRWMQELGESVWQDYTESLRMVDGVAARLDRLKAIGNGQVPLCAATAWRILSD
jgi:DNA (cytosine-5)-methyltransferase 1